MRSLILLITLISMGGMGNFIQNTNSNISQIDYSLFGTITIKDSFLIQMSDLQIIFIAISFGDIDLSEDYRYYYPEPISSGDNGTYVMLDHTMAKYDSVFNYLTNEEDDKMAIEYRGWKETVNSDGYFFRVEGSEKSYLNGTPDLYGIKSLKIILELRIAVYDRDSSGYLFLDFDIEFWVSNEIEEKSSEITHSTSIHTQSNISANKRSTNENTTIQLDASNLSFTLMIFVNIVLINKTVRPRNIDRFDK